MPQVSGSVHGSNVTLDPNVDGFSASPGESGRQDERHEFVSINPRPHQKDIC